MRLLFPLRIGKTRVSIFAILTLFAVLYSDFSVFTAEILLSAFLHELGHIWAIKLFGVSIYRIDILPFGAEISSNAALLPYKKEAAVALSGIAVNLIAGFAVFFVWLFTRDIYTLFFFVCSMFLAFVNAVPVPSFDGARALEAYFSAKLSDEKCFAVMENVYYFSFLFLVIFSLYVLNASKGNFSMIIVLCYMFVCSYANKKASVLRQDAVIQLTEDK